MSLRVSKHLAQGPACGATAIAAVAADCGAVAAFAAVPLKTACLNLYSCKWFLIQVAAASGNILRITLPF